MISLGQQTVRWLARRWHIRFASTSSSLARTRVRTGSRNRTQSWVMQSKTDGHGVNSGRENESDRKSEKDHVKLMMHASVCLCCCLLPLALPLALSVTQSPAYLSLCPSSSPQSSFLCVCAPACKIIINNKNNVP